MVALYSKIEVFQKLEGRLLMHQLITVRPINVQCIAEFAVPLCQMPNFGKWSQFFPSWGHTDLNKLQPWEIHYIFACSICFELLPPRWCLTNRLIFVVKIYTSPLIPCWQGLSKSFRKFKMTSSHQFCAIVFKDN